MPELEEKVCRRCGAGFEGKPYFLCHPCRKVLTAISCLRDEDVVEVMVREKVLKASRLWRKGDDT